LDLKQQKDTTKQGCFSKDGCAEWFFRTGLNGSSGLDGLSVRIAGRKKRKLTDTGLFGFTWIIGRKWIFSDRILDKD
jgi:hypothetical protein